MNRLRLNCEPKKKALFGTPYSSAPYYDPLGDHVHNWKKESVINSQDPTALQFAQNPDKSNIDNREPVIEGREYCSLCHILRPPVFKMKGGHVLGSDFQEPSCGDEETKLFSAKVLTCYNGKPPIQVPTAWEWEHVTELMNEMISSTVSTMETVPEEDDEMEISDEEYEESEVSVTEEFPPKYIEEGVGELREPNITSRSITRSSIHDKNLKRVKKRKKPSLFINKEELKDTRGAMTMILKEKSHGVFRCGGKYRAEKRIKTKKIGVKKKVLLEVQQ